jgi:hypothetical protein
MKTTINLTASIFIIVFASTYILSVVACTKDTNITPANNNQRQASTTMQSNARSGFTSSQRFEISLPVSIPCANNGSGEDVLLEGILHETFHLTVNNNKFLLKIIDNPQGISGTGQVTGDKYHATGETQDVINQSFVNGVYNETYVNNFRIIGQGTGNNFIVHENFHITVNANGTVTALLDNLTADCK